MTRRDGFAACVAAAMGLLAGGLALAALEPQQARAQAAAAYDPMAPRRPTGPAAGKDVPLNPEFDNLPDTEGMEDVYYTCSGCHSLAIVKQQRLTDERWDATLEWMVEVQKMPEPDEEAMQRIRDYLKRHFSSEG